MFQARQEWQVDGEGAEVLAFPAAVGAKGDFGRRAARPGFNLVVDLHSEEIGPRWFKGAATLAALCCTAIFLVPGFHPYTPAPKQAPTTLHNQSLSELAMPELPVEDPGAALPRPVGVQVGTSGAIKRTSGDISGGLYFSLRAAGATPQVASEYLKAISTRIDVGEVAPFDRFDFAVVKGAAGEPDRLVYAALDRVQSDDVKLISWTANGSTQWVDGGEAPRVSSGLMAPVAGRITSGFGYRYHPILHFTRLHAGIDFGAPYGAPIAAAADGQIIGAGYAGGYGRQVRVLHSGGVVTTYSHMSSIVAQPGMPVRQGQVIGYVGASGLATGPHLHFEVRINGQPVNPLTARLVSRPAFQGPQLAAFKERLKALTSIPMKPLAGATVDPAAS